MKVHVYTHTKVMHQDIYLENNRKIISFKSCETYFLIANSGKVETVSKVFKNVATAK